MLFFNYTVSIGSASTIKTTSVLLSLVHSVLHKLNMDNLAILHTVFCF